MWYASYPGWRSSLCFSYLTSCLFSQFPVIILLNLFLSPLLSSIGLSPLTFVFLRFFSSTMSIAHFTACFFGVSLSYICISYFLSFTLQSHTPFVGLTNFA